MTTRQKIVYYSHTGLVSGAEKVLFTMLRGVDDSFQPILIAPNGEQMNRFCHENQIPFYPVPELKARFTLNPIRLVGYLSSAVQLIQQVRFVLRKERPSFVHANSTRAGLVASLASSGSNISVLWHIHDVLPNHPISSFIRLIALCSRRNRIIAVSRAAARGFQGKFLSNNPRVPISVLHNGVDSYAGISDETAIHSLLQESGISNTDFKIGIVGQITPRKGHLELIRSFATMLAIGCRPAKLLIVGSAIFNRDQDYLESLKNEVRRFGLDNNVKFLGHRSDISTVFQSLDVLVLNSSSEPFSLVLLEALAHATPVIAARVDGVPELIDDGLTGKLFDHGNEPQLIAAIQFCANHPAEAALLGKNGRLHVQSAFTRDQFLRQLRSIYSLVHAESKSASNTQAVERQAI